MEMLVEITTEKKCRGNSRRTTEKNGFNLCGPLVFSLFFLCGLSILYSTFIYNNAK